MNQLMRVWQICEKLPFGKIIFSKLVCFKAPYFANIKPRFIELRPGYCEIHFKKRRAVTNHLKSVHAIAMCNVSELAAGSMLEVSIPKNMRWIPKEMTVSYLKMAKTNLKATCEMTAANLVTPQELPMTVHVTDTNGVEVFRAVINMYISEKQLNN